MTSWNGAVGIAKVLLLLWLPWSRRSAAYILQVLQFRVKGIAPDGHCLFRSFSVIAEALNIRMDVWEARHIGAEAWRIEDGAADALLGMYAPLEEGDPPCEVWSWLQGNIGEKTSDPNTLVEAYKQGVFKI